MHSLSKEHPLRQLFSGLVEQAFMADMGICDTHLTDYLGDLLADFLHVDQIYPFRSVDGAAIREVSLIEAQAHLAGDLPEPMRKRLINRYIGDLTLFWTGVFPESLRPRSGPDRLREFLIQGKRSYEIASQLSDPDARPPSNLLRRLSEEFESCVHGLHLVRCGWERLKA